MRLHPDEHVGDEVDGATPFASRNATFEIWREPAGVHVD
jgi:hypothetical protein